MGEAVGIRGKFKAKKERYPEIQKVLIEGLSQHLEPDDSPVIWENYFQAKEDCLKLCFESYGNYGRAEEWIRQKFSKEYSDVTVEFGVLVYDEYGYTADGYVLGDDYEGSRSSVVVTVEDCNNNLYTLEDEPFKCSPTNCGDAYFKGDLKKILLQYIKSEWEKVLVQNFEVVCDGSRENTQLVEELHVGARVDLEVIAYSKNDWFDRSYLNMRVYHKENLLGEIKLSELNGIDPELVHAILKGNKCSVSGLVTRVIPLSQRYKGAKKPLIQMKIVADQIETVEGIPEKILIYDTVKELCDFLTKSVEDDFGDMGGCYGDDVFEELFWTEHNQKLAERKKQFIENVMRNIKDISDIKTIYVQREYYAWGDSADWVADNDAELCEYAEKVMASKGKERKAIMDEMKRYIHTPRAERGCGIFARGMEIRYIWNYDDTELLKLCKRLINGERPDFECGREYKKIDLEKRQYKEYAEIELRYEMVEKRNK